MKKIIALLMAALLVFAFAGCTDTKVDEETSTNEALEDASVAVASDLDYIKNKGTLVVGITDYAPMDYKVEGSDEWTGFDAEFARAFGEELGVKVEFIEIDWDNKVFELDAKKIDCIWNGMTITDEITLKTSVSDPYVKNAQVVVMKKDKVVEFSGHIFDCLDGGFGKNEAVDVVVRPEDVDVVPVEQGMLTGTVTSVTFKGVHYEIIVDINGFKWMIQTTDFVDVDEHIGLYIEPDAIHIMHKSEYSGMYGDYSSFSNELDELSDAESEPEE